MTFRCTTCGEDHDGLPDVAYEWPDLVAQIPEIERPRRVQGNADLCSLDDEHFFVRGVLLLPVLDADPPRELGLGVWVSHAAENFRAYQEHPDSARIGPFFGWLMNEVAAFPHSTGLKTMAHYGGGDGRPSIVLEETEHPLAVAQRGGITLARAWEIVHGRA